MGAGQRTWLAFGAILAVATFLRFYGLDFQSFWYDEIYSVQFSRLHDLARVISEGCGQDTHPPGHLIILYFFEKLLGHGEWAARLPSALAGTAAVAAAFFLGLRLYSAAEALVFSGLLAVFWAPVFFSQEARAYGMMILFSELSFLYWLRLVRELESGGRVGWTTAAGLVLNSLVLAYLHYFGTWLVFLEGLGAMALFLSRRRAFLAAAGTYLAVFLGYLPWLPTMWRHLQRGEFWTDPPSWEFVTGLWRFMVNRSEPLAWAALGLVVFFLARRSWQAMRGREFGSLRQVILSSDFLVLAWLVVPFGLAMLKSFFSTPMTVARYYVVILPALYLLLSRGLVTLPLPARGRALLAGAVVAGLTAHLVLGLGYYSRPHKAQYREVAAYIKANQDAAPNYALAAYTWRAGFFDFYLEKEGLLKEPVPKIGMDWDLPKLLGFIKSRSVRHVWYMWAEQPPWPGFIAGVLGRFEVVRHKSFFKAEVWLLRLKDRAGPDQSLGDPGARTSP